MPRRRPKKNTGAATVGYEAQLSLPVSSDRTRRGCASGQASNNP